jgi:L,D-transpeptidase YcbB
MIARTVSGLTLAAFLAAVAPLANAQEAEQVRPPANASVEAAQTAAPDPLASEERSHLVQEPDAAEKPIEAAQAERAAPDPLAPQDKDEPVLAPGATEKPAEVAETPRAEEQDPIPAQILSRLASADGKADAREDVAGLTAFYKQTKGQPVWTSKDGFTANAQKAIAEIRAADDWGLDASAFQLPANPEAGAALETLADAEIKLSLAVLKYARHARGGRLDPPSIADVMDRRPHLYDPKSVLQGIAAAESADAYLRGLHPRHEQFKRLRQALIALGKSGTSGTASSPSIRIPAGPNFKPGDNDPQIALVRKRLQAGLDAPRDTLYDAALVEAVNRYRKEHDLGVTGIIDKKLRASLNESVSASPDEKRMRILVNMERWRWMPDNLGEFHVWNSLPEQITRVFDHGKKVLEERIVVGKPTSQTPSFTANMQFVIFHPEWGVPDGIKVNEIAPKLRRAGGGGDSFWLFGGGGEGGSSRVLQRMGGLRVTLNGREVDPDSVDWASVDIRRFQFIQGAGARNVLGVVKFRFPNKHDVYMHDTSDRNLFSSSPRAFSHGCMRTQNPVHLAEVLLAHDKGFTPAQVRQLVESEATNEIKLTSEIPVHVVYFTAEADEHGQLRTFTDLYGLDAKVASALKGQPVHFANDPVMVAQNQDQRPMERGEQWGRGRDDPRDPYASSRDWGGARDRQRSGPFGRSWNPFESWN